MLLDFHFVCPLRNGIHARPASALEEVSRLFDASITVTNERTGCVANAKSVLAIIGADIRGNDPCRFNINGIDAEEARKALSAFLWDEFPRCDDDLPKAPLSNGSVLPLPPGLQQSGATIFRGTPVVHGVGRGRIVQMHSFLLPESIPIYGVIEVEEEVRKLEATLKTLVTHYEERLRSPGSRLETDLLRAHLSVARDPEFSARLEEAVRQDKRTVAGAILDTERHFTNRLKASASLLLRERTPDIRDVCLQLLRELCGPGAAPVERHLTEDSVVVAHMLTPEQLLGLERHFLKGLVLGHAGTGSHTVILARSFGIPTLTGMPNLENTACEGQETIVDGDLGVMFVKPTEAVRRYYILEERRCEGRRSDDRRFASQPAVTCDGHRVEIAANIATAQEASAAFDSGAESIGLFRTEALFFGRDVPPTEQEQFEEYRRTLTFAGQRAVVLRTLDIGGDKPLSYLNLPKEHNPFLGSRAVRIYPQFETLFRTQVRAMIRASAFGQLKLLVPMVTTLEEVRWVKQIIAEEQASCAARNIPYDNSMPIGAMIEVPAAVFLIDVLGRELDFFSIGSNDLLQGFVAVDRTNLELSYLYDPLQPAFLRLLKKTIEDAHASGKKISLCGEMGGQNNILPLLVGLGLDIISAVPPVLAGLKAELSAWSIVDCRQLALEAVQCETASEVRQLMERHAPRRAVPLITPEMFLLDSNGTTKEEVIKEMVDQMYVLGRTDQPRVVEEAVWRRESAYSTGFGYGIAIPHCKIKAVAASSLGVLKLRTPVAWNSSDGQPVNTVILLAIRDSEHASSHMKILAQLARKLMHEEFRERLVQERNPAALCAFLKECLNL